MSRTRYIMTVALLCEALMLPAHLHAQTQPPVAGHNSATAAEAACRDYTMDSCTPEATCFELAGNPCGSQAGKACTDKGVVACGFHGCPGERQVAMICDFE